MLYLFNHNIYYVVAAVLLINIYIMVSAVRLNRKNNIYNNMAKLFNIPRARLDNFGKIILSSKSPEDFIHLIGHNINTIIPFDNGTDDLLEQGAIILPRHYYIFVGTNNNELQYKPYEFNQYRIVVSTTRDIISSIDSIG